MSRISRSTDFFNSTLKVPDAKGRLHWKPYKSLLKENVGHNYDDEIEEAKAESASPGGPALPPDMAKFATITGGGKTKMLRCWQYDPFSETATRAQIKSLGSMKNNPLADRIIDECCGGEQKLELAKVGQRPL